MMECKVINTMGEILEVIFHSFDKELNAAICYSSSHWTIMNLVPNPFTTLPFHSSLLQLHTQMGSILPAVLLN